MEQPKKKINWFFKILICFFFVYVALLIAFEAGYYENKMQNKAVLTKEAMEQFEQDLNEGKIVDVKNYLEEDKKDYSTGVTKIGNRVSKDVSDIMTNGISGIFEVLKGLFW